MILVAALIASCQCLASDPISSSANVAQDSSSIYASAANTLQRISKATGESTMIAPPSDRQISGIDVDGSTVYYGTSTSVSGCSTINDVETCTDDGQSANEISFVPTTGGPPGVLVSGLRSVVGISHDATHVYWVEASTRIDAPSPPYSKSDARIRRIDKGTGAIDTVADGLVIPYYESDLVAFDDAFVYYTTGVGLVRYAKSDGVITILTSSFGGPIAIDDTNIYAGSLAVSKDGGMPFQWIDVTQIPDQRGEFSVLGAGGGRVLYSTFYADQRTTFGTFYSYDFCSGTSTLLGTSSNPSTEFAFDSCAIYLGANNYAPSCAAAPVRIISVDPPSARAGGHSVITITGSGFDGSATADIGGQPALIQTLTSTRIELVAPGNTQGATFLRVHNGDGSCGAAPFLYFSVRRRAVASGGK